VTALAVAVVVSVLVASLASLVAAPSSPAGAETNGSWSIFPTTVAGQQQRPYFQPTLTAGQTYSDSVTVINQTGTTATFNLYGADAYNSSAGGFALKRRTDKQTAMGLWIQLPITQITLTGRSFEVIPFSIVVPAGTPPGDHAGGIVIESTTGTTTVHGSLSVTVLQAVAVRVYGRVQGKLVRSMAVTHLSVSPQTSVSSLFGFGTPSKVTFTVANTGNVRLASVASVSLKPLIGGAAGTKVVQIPQLLPDNSVTYTLPFKSVIPFGQLTANVHLTAAGSTSTGSSSALVIPWLLLLVLALIVALIVWSRRRRRRGDAAGGRTPRGSPAAAPDEETEEPELEPEEVGSGASE
jgi:hypothetical protein